jgi:hypothetical protein
MDPKDFPLDSDINPKANILRRVLIAIICILGPVRQKKCLQ